MSDSPLFGPDDEAEQLEALLRDIDASDLENARPPPQVWMNIEAAIRADPRQPDVRPGTVAHLGSRTSRTSRTSTIVLAAAATVAILTIGAVVRSSIWSDDAVSPLRRSSIRPTSTPSAQTPPPPLASWSATGSSEFVSSRPPFPTLTRTTSNCG